MDERPDTIPGSIPALGAPIFTEDGRRIGAVKEVREDCFKVGAPWHIPYWLPVAAVESVGTERVTLLVPAAWLNDCKRGAPRAA